MIGTGLAHYRGTFAPLPAIAALAGALLIQIATNLANDYYDFARGADTKARVGPMRVTQAGLLSPAAVKGGMLVALAAAFAVGIYLAGVGGWPIVIIGLASLACAVGYTAGPYPLAYHGLGDVFVFVFFGLVAVSGTYYVQALAFTPESLLAGAGIGALSTAILVVNNLRDRETDARAGKRTLAVRMGVGASRAEYVALLAVAAGVPIAGVLLYDWPAFTLVSLIAVASAVGPAHAVLTFRGPHDLIPALGKTARVVAIYGVLLGGAFMLG